MKCERCRQEISQERLDAVPETTFCVKCLVAKGDVETKKGRLVFDHKTGGHLEVLSGRQLDEMNRLPEAIEGRLGRL